MDERQLERFGQAVERKKEESKEASEQTGERRAGSSPVSGDQESLEEKGRPQDARDERKKSSGKGKMTADKWNQ